MALRCLSSMSIDGTTYPLMQLSDLSFISDSYTTETQISVSGTVTNNTDFASVHSDISVETFYDTSLCPFTKFVRDLNTLNEKRIRLVSKENEQQSYYNICLSSLPTSDNCKVYWAFVVDDVTHKGYKVIKETRLGNSAYYTQYDTRYYYAFTGIKPYTSNGGGATHIAKVTGQLKDLSSNMSDILLVSGGGGGGLIIGEDAYVGADAGGKSGSSSNSANQTTGYAFGQGGSGTNASGGGSGLYGGFSSDNVLPPDYSYISRINDMDIYNANCTSHYSVFDDTHKYGWWRSANNTFYEYTPIKPLNEMTICANSGLTAHHNKNKTGTGNNIYTSFSTTIITIKLNGNDNDGYDVTYENDSRTTLGNAFTGVYSGEQSYKGARLSINDDHSNPGAFTSLGGYSDSGSSGYYGNFTNHYNSLSSALESIYDSFCNVNLYINDVLWVSV